MAAITMKIEDKEVRRLLKGLLAFTGDLTPVMKNISIIMLNRTEECFRNEETPEGIPWHPLAPATITQRLRLGYGGEHPILWREGWLGGHFVPDAGRTWAKVGTAVPYAAIHHKGGKAGRGRKVTIPERPFLGLASEDWDEIKATINREIRRLTGGI